MSETKVSDLKPNAKNPRKISDDALARLAKSLETLGDLGGVVWNVQLRRLSGGHQHLKVLPEDAEIQIIHRYETPTTAGTIADGFIRAWGELHKYREVMWDETRDKLAMLAANKHGGAWDYGLLSEYLLELDTSGADLDLSGFTFDEIANILAPVTPTELQSHALQHSYTFSIRCGSDDEINRIRDFFGVMQSGVDYEKFCERCL
jgi:hypothetical protein